jgi:hypothetical protein
MRADLRIVVFTLSAIYFLAVGTYKASHFSGDFIAVYAGARCLVQGCNPYDPAQLQRQYTSAQPGFWFAHPPIYPPSTLLALSPLAQLPFRAASVIWALLGGSLLIAAVLVLWVTRDDSSWVPTLLVSFILILEARQLGGGNPVTLACALAVIGTTLFLIERYVPLAAGLLALSLAVKPQVAGLIILYLLMRGVSRRWAAVSLGGGLAFLLGGILILEMHPGSQHWFPSLRANLAECVLPGHINDPTPANPQGGLANLQTLTSVFLTNPKAWNEAALGITLVLFVLWIVVLKKLEDGAPNHFLALPPLLVLSLLPVYHRSCDALILLLSVPMIAMIMRSHKVLGTWLALATVLPILSDFTVGPIISATGHFWNLREAVSHRGVFILLMRPWCPELLLLFGLYVIAIRLSSPRLAESCVRIPIME